MTKNDYSIRLRLVADDIESVSHKAQRIPLIPDSVKREMLSKGVSNAKFLRELADYLENTHRVENDGE